MSMHRLKFDFNLNLNAHTECDRGFSRCSGLRLQFKNTENTEKTPETLFYMTAVTENSSFQTKVLNPVNLLLQQEIGVAS